MNQPKKISMYELYSKINCSIYSLKKWRKENLKPESFKFGNRVFYDRQKVYSFIFQSGRSPIDTTRTIIEINPDSINPEFFYQFYEVIKFIKVSRQSLNRWYTNRTNIRFYNFNGMKRVYGEDILRYIKFQTPLNKELNLREKMEETT